MCDTNMFEKKYKIIFSSQLITEAIYYDRCIVLQHSVLMFAICFYFYSGHEVDRGFDYRSPK